MDNYLSIESPLQKFFDFKVSEFGDEEKKYAVNTRGKFGYYEISVFSNNTLFDKYFFILVNFLFEKILDYQIFGNY